MVEDRTGIQQCVGAEEVSGRRGYPMESRGTCIHDDDGVCSLHGPGAVLGFKPVRIATPGPNGKKMTRNIATL